MGNQDTNHIDASQYEFLDFGCSGGGSLAAFSQMFDAEDKGLGLDIDPEKVSLAIENGHNAVVCDITKIKLKDKVRFGVMHHFLEHIPDLMAVKNIVKKACHVIDDFILIRQPYFDADPYLFSQGFKFYWSDWHGHPNRMTLLEFHNILMPLVKAGAIKSFSLYGLHPVTSSEDIAVHNLDSDMDQQQWDIEKHSQKSVVEFTTPVYKEVMALVDINGESTDLVEQKIPLAVRLFSSESNPFDSED